MTMKYGKEWYDKYWLGATWPLQKYHVEAYREMTGEILDVGCGNIKIDDAIGVDWSIEALKKRGGQRVQATAEKLPFKNKRFNTVAALELLEHVEDIHQVLREMKRVCREKIVVTVPLNHWSPSHKWNLTLEEWCKILKQYGKIESTAIIDERLIAVIKHDLHNNDKLE